jgi:hypothetical protein
MIRKKIRVVLLYLFVKIVLLDILDGQHVDFVIQKELAQEKEVVMLKVIVFVMEII